MASQNPALDRKRQLIWGGFAARCSVCQWQRNYNISVSVHRLPDEELSEVIRGEFAHHTCENFPAAK